MNRNSADNSLQIQDVLSNYLFNLLTTDKDVSEPFCRLIIRELLNREVGKVNILAERIELPGNPKKRGVRLDVEVMEYNENGENVATIYDIEPHKDSEKFYPKKNRYTQSMIDRNHLNSGEKNFGKLPDLYIICITNFDPFGYDRMVYTIKHQCIEEPELCYNDGVQILYFYTKGTKGGNESLRSFLKYLEHSEEANVVDAATREVEKYVEQVKERNRETMYTVGEWIDDIVNNGTKEKQKIIETQAEAIAKKDRVIAKKDTYIKELEAKLAQTNSK